MAWRTVLLQSPMKLNLDHGQLKCERDDGTITLPIEDITVLVVDSPRILLTSTLLNAMQKKGAAVVICDEKHHPGGIFLPFHQHTRISALAPLQAKWTQPFRKRCWQIIIQSKIMNQAECLSMLDRPGREHLIRMVGEVKSGDSGNMEARAAREYWNFYIGPHFQRRTHRDKARDFINKALNYGYAVIRAAVARSITAHGLLPCFGLHHDSNLNPFNLADDLVESFRPLVDAEVHRMVEEMPEGENDLIKIHRQRLVGLTTRQVGINKEYHSLTNAADILTESLVRATKDKNPNKLLLPSLVKDSS